MRWVHVLARASLAAFLLALFVVVLAPSALAAPGEDPCACTTCECRKPAAPTCPPKYENRRFEEDWSACLCKPICDLDDWTDRLKARPLGQGSTIWIGLGGQIRARYEGWVNQGFSGAPTADDAWGLLRVRTHADLHLGRFARVFVEGIFADQWERELGPRPIDRNRGDLLNAFLELKGEAAGWKGLVRGGRLELEQGKQRLVSPLDWGNTRRTFQGVSGRLTRGTNRIDLFAVRPVTVLATEFDEWNDDVGFWGIYYTNTRLTCLTWEAYVMGLHRDAGVYLGQLAAEDRYTLGGRVGGEIPGTRFDYDAEAALQLGTFGARDIAAWMGSVELGYKPCEPCLKPRIAVGLDHASGGGPTGDLGTFHQLFPLGHAYLGYADLIGRQNVVAGRLTATVEPADKLTVRADLHGFWRADDADAVYNAAGGVLRAPGASRDTQVGTELDLTFAYAIDRHWKVTGGWVHFWTGDFLRATGPSNDLDFFYLDAQVTF